MINILSNRITPRMKRALEIAEEMSKILVPQKTKNNRHITFILHKDLQRFPLAMLRRNGRYLLETHTISQAPNLAVYYFTQKEPAPRFNRPIFYFSDAPDDPTAPEREILHKCFPGAETFATLDRTEMEAAMSRGDFVHFAGHCVFNKRYPDESYLQLGGTRISLTAYARFRLTNHPFLNLAACQSGWMALGAGNEPHGFVIGSFAAGATALLAGLWEIDDMATGTWMNVFYGALSKGLSGAYREACLALIEADHDPYQWAGFSLLGRA